MCSNTSSGSYGDRDNYSGACLKKQKKERLPRRGPGVAELEKILRDQEKKCTVVSDCSPPFISSSNSSATGNLLSVAMDQSPFSPPIPLSPTPLPPLQPAAPPVTTLYSNSNINNMNINNSNFRVTNTNGTGSILSNMGWPEKSSSLPVMEDCRNASGFSYLLNGSIQSQVIPPLLVFQRKPPSSHQSQMMNPPQHLVVPPLSNPPSVVYQFIEPPSNQRSYHDYTSQWPEEEKVVRAKRQRHFLIDSSLNSLMNSKCTNTGQANIISRQVVQSSSLDLRLKSFVSDYGPTSGNSITIGSSASATPPASAQTCPQDFSNSKFIRPYFQYDRQRENVEEHSQQRSGTSLPFHRKPFYSFLQEQNDGEETAFGLNSERCEANGDYGIDLNLKL